MTELNKTFGNMLEQFALSVDIVNEQTFSDIWSLIEEYLAAELKIEYFSILCEGEIDGKPGLQIHRQTGGGTPSYNLKKEDGSSNGWSAYSYLNNKRLWVVGEDKKPLRDAEKHRDCWSKVDGLPRFDRQTDDEVRTAILVPLKISSSVHVVIDLESTIYQESTRIAKKELDLISETVSKVYALWEANTTQRQNKYYCTSLKNFDLKETYHECVGQTFIPV